MNHTKYLILIFSFLSINSSIGQEKIDVYNMSYFGEKDFEIQATKPKKDNFQYFIDAFGIEGDKDQVTLLLNSKDVEDFKKNILQARAKYVEWKEIAIKNGVEQLDKDIETGKIKTSAAFVYGREWEFDFSAILTCRYKISDGKHLLIINSNELTSSSNEFIKYDGLYFVFQNLDELDFFLSKLDNNKVLKHFKKDDLFKN